MTEFGQLLENTGVEETVEGVRSAYLLDKISIGTSGHGADGGHGLIATAVESLALASDQENERAEMFERAFVLRRNTAFSRDLSGLVAAASLAADGVLANRSAEVPMLLRGYEIPALDDLVGEQDQFSLHLFVRTVRAFLLLVRRSNGWADLRASAAEISLLREEHDRAAGMAEEIGSALSVTQVVQLVSGFNLAKIVDLTSTYTASGQPTNVQVQFDRHAGNRDELGKYGPDAVFGSLGDLIQAACARMIQVSIWTGTTRLGKAVREFVGALASPDKTHPLLELWPSQRSAIDSHLLDPARRAIVIEMPTSAGKTLIAEFSIIQARALNPESAIVYVVPTRALVNQITQRLRRDFTPLGLAVEAAIPVFELDPTEDALLQGSVDILVSTPEKLDLLIKANHPSVEELALVVIDEAHNIADGARGARLELLLGLIKRERPETRFLLLTPFVPNGEELASWLGDGAESTIGVDWRPSERVAVTAHWMKPRSKPYELRLTTIASAGNVDVAAGHSIAIGTPREVKVSSKAETTVELCSALAERGGVLVLARGKGTVEARAREIAQTRPEVTPGRLLRAVIHYAEDELGLEHLLPQVLSRGVAYHHAGLSHDLRYLIEQLIDAGDVQIVVGTTTLAQGLNFPISSVIVETLTRSQGYGKPWKELSYSEFWNIAGRAGRAMRDPLGLVAFPCVTRADREKVSKFLAGEATAVASVLLDATSAIGDAALEFNLALTRRNPDLSVFLQYLAHVARVGGADQTATDLEDVLRSSLVFHQAREQSPELSRALLSIARKFVNALEREDRGFLALADGTGFSLASAKLVYAQTADLYPEFRSTEFWSKNSLFGSDSSALTKVVSLLSDVPELSLGITDSSSGAFDPEVVAGITRDWVCGSSLTTIAERWFRFPGMEPDQRLRAASSYIHGKLVGQVPWGIGAMQKLVLAQSLPDSESLHVPSYVFYGVNSWDAVLMRMSGVPRGLAHSIGALWGTERPESFGALREWLSRLPSDEWERSAADKARLTGDEAEMLWRTLAGADDTAQLGASS